MKIYGWDRVYRSPGPVPIFTNTNWCFYPYALRTVTPVPPLEGVLTSSVLLGSPRGPWVPKSRVGIPEEWVGPFVETVPELQEEVTLCAKGLDDEVERVGSWVESPPPPSLSNLPQGWARRSPSSAIPSPGPFAWASRRRSRTDARSLRSWTTLRTTSHRTQTDHSDDRAATRTKARESFRNRSIPYPPSPSLFFTHVVQENLHLSRIPLLRFVNRHGPSSK